MSKNKTTDNKNQPINNGNDANKARRRLVKSIGVGGGAFMAAKSLPEKWTTPVVNSVLLPAHAVTSNNPLSGSRAATLSATDSDEFRGVVDNAENSGRSLLDAIISPAQAAVGNLTWFAYAERDFAMGDGWYFVQVLASENIGIVGTGGDEFRGYVNSDGNFGRSVLDTLISPAQADPPSCFFQILWETHLQLNFLDDSKWFSDIKKNLSPTDKCGEAINLFFADKINIQLGGFNDQNAATKGRVLVTNLGDIPIDVFSGGSRLLANCFSNPCVFDSDHRLKEHIEQITSFSGINFYRWRWNACARDKFGHTGSAVGVIAQEVAQIFPDVIAHRGGFLAVDYQKLGNYIFKRHLP